MNDYCYFHNLDKLEDLLHMINNNIKGVREDMDKLTKKIKILDDAVLRDRKKKVK